MEMDGRDFEQVRPILERAREARAWLVLAGLTCLCLLVGMIVFSWREYLDSAT